MRYIRITLAGITLVAMTLLFTVPTAACCRYFGWLPRAQLVPAVLAGEFLALVGIALSVLLFGRLYCSVVCPLGIAQDVSRAVFGWSRIRRTARSLSSGRGVRICRYVLLSAFAIAAVFGFTGLVEPYGIFGRFLGEGLGRSGEPPMTVVVWSISLFAFIIAMTAFRARWWCNLVCPVGTFLALFSRFAIFRVRIDEAKCVGCGLCARRCEKGALIVDGKKAGVDHELCTSCFDCSGICPATAITRR